MHERGEGILWPAVHQGEPTPRPIPLPLAATDPFGHLGLEGREQAASLLPATGEGVHQRDLGTGPVQRGHRIERMLGERGLQDPERAGRVASEDQGLPREIGGVRQHDPGESALLAHLHVHPGVALRFGEPPPDPRDPRQRLVRRGQIGGIGVGVAPKLR